MIPQPAAPASPSYPASDGRAAMDALWGDGVPTVDRQTRGWLVHQMIEHLKVVRCHGETDFAVRVTLDEIAVCEGDFLPVSRDDLRVLLAWSGKGASLPYPSEADFHALSRAAAALGETLPEWMREHAAREGWTT